MKKMVNDVGPGVTSVELLKVYAFISGAHSYQVCG